MISTPSGDTAPATRSPYTGPPWVDPTLDRGPDRRVLVATLIGAVATDVAVRSSGHTGFAGAALVAVVSGLVLGSGRVVNPQAVAVVAAAPFFGMWMGLRASPWLLVMDVVAAGGLLAVGSSFARRGSIFDLTIPTVLARTANAIVHGVSAPGFVLGALGQGGHLARGLALLGGLALAAPLLVVLVLLLSSADAVFASFLPTFAPPSLAEHVILLLLGAWAVAGLLRLASARPLTRLPAMRPWLGRVEALVVLASMVLVYAAFAVAQLVALSAGGQKVIETAGLTYAEYARSGFFQLLAAAALTLATLLALRATSVPSAGFLPLAELAVALTLVGVFVAARRLQLYEQAFGLTMLRLYSLLFALWIAGVFVLLGWSLAGLGAPRRWFLASAVGLGLAGTLLLNAVNPEGLVVRRNLARAERTGRFDADYAAGLSDDALPTLVRGLAELDPLTARQATSAICSSTAGDQRRRWLAYNRSREAGRRIRRAVCSDRLRRSGGEPEDP